MCPEIVLGAREALLALTAHWSVRLRDGVLTASKAGALITDVDKAAALTDQIVAELARTGERRGATSEGDGPADAAAALRLAAARPRGRGSSTGSSTTTV